MIDVSCVTAMDSQGLGVLLRVIRQARAADVAGCFLAPSQAVRLVVEATRLARILPFASDMEEARKRLAADVAAARLRPVAGVTDGVLSFSLPPRITAEIAGTYGQTVRGEWDSHPAIRDLVFDLAETKFLDSSGLGLLIRCHRLAGQREGGRLRLINLQDTVRKVIQTAKLEPVLLPEKLL